MIRKILETKNPILRQRSKPVVKIDKKILALAKDLQDTLLVQKDPVGVGLAAPQIGKSLRIFVVKDKNKIRTIINPEVISVSTAKKRKGKNEIMEGCLSLPNYYGELKRANLIKLKYQNLKGKEVVEIFGGFSAQIIQHEMDHLEGILFIDKLLKQNIPLYKYDNKTKDWEMVEF